MRIQEIDPSYELENYIDFEKISPAMLHAVVNSFHRSALDADVDRSTLIQTLYGINGVPGDPFDLFSGGFNALGPGFGMDWNFDDPIAADPLEQQSKKLENRLLQSRIETERARAELVRAKKRQAASLADEAAARAETQRSFLPDWKKPK